MDDQRDRSGMRGDEDDWFAAPGSDPFDSDTIVWEDPEPPRAPRRRPSPLAGPWVAIAALVGAVVLIVGGVLLAQSLTDSDGSSTTPTAPTATSPSTTPATTPPTDTTPTTTPEPSTGDITLPQGVKLRSGDSGSGVEAVQQALAKLGYDPGPIDGDFGPSTQAAVVAFQTAEGLSADGIVGADTLTALAAALSTG